MGHEVRILSPTDLEPQNLFASLRRADDEGAAFILASAPEGQGLGLAVADRLQKAAAPRDSAD